MTDQVRKDVENLRETVSDLQEIVGDQRMLRYGIPHGDLWSAVQDTYERLDFIDECASEEQVSRLEEDMAEFMQRQRDIMDALESVNGTLFAMEQRITKLEQNVEDTEDTIEVISTTLLEMVNITE